MLRLTDVHHGYTLTTPEGREVIDVMLHGASLHATPPRVTAALAKALAAVDAAERLELLDDYDDADRGDADQVAALDQAITHDVRALYLSLSGSAARGTQDPVGGPAGDLLALAFPHGTSGYNVTRNGKRAARLHALVLAIKEPRHAPVLTALSLVDLVAALDTDLDTYTRLTRDKTPIVASEALTTARADMNEAICAAVLLAILVDNQGGAPNDFRDAVVYPYLRVCDRIAAAYRARHPSRARAQPSADGVEVAAK